MTVRWEKSSYVPKGGNRLDEVDLESESLDILESFYLKGALGEIWSFLSNGIHQRSET